MAKQTTASKPKSTYFSSSPKNKNIKYKLLCAATAGNLDAVRKRLRFSIDKKLKNGNVALYCGKFGEAHRRCNYRALFVAKNKAIYVKPGQAHNHPVNVPANAAQKDNKEREAAVNVDGNGEEPMAGEEANQNQEPPKNKEQKLAEVEGKRLLARVQDGWHLAQLCGQNKLKEMGRQFRCEQANCPFRATFLSDESELYVFNNHNH